MRNAFKYTKQLEEAGFSREQAEIQLQIITEVVEDDLATKQDLQILETNLMNVIDAKFHRVEIKLNDVEIKFNNLENKIQQAEYRLTIKLGTLMLIGFTSIATLMKFWIGH